MERRRLERGIVTQRRLQGIFGGIRFLCIRGRALVRGTLCKFSRNVPARERFTRIGYLFSSLPTSSTRELRTSYFCSFPLFSWLASGFWLLIFNWMDFGNCENFWILRLLNCVLYNSTNVHRAEFKGLGFYSEYWSFQEIDATIDYTSTYSYLSPSVSRYILQT